MGGYISVAALAAIQRVVAPQLMGRVMSLFMVASVGVSPISFALAGVVAQLSVLALFVASGALVLGTGLGSLAFADVRRL
jgi:hypothetical protein